MATVRLYSENDERMVAALIRDHMPLPEYSAGYLQWKMGFSYRSIAQDIQPFGVVTEENGSIVSFACFFPYLLWNGSYIWNIDDVVTHQQYRRRGLFRKTMEYGLAVVDKKGEGCYLFSSAMAREGYYSLGFKEDTTLSYYICASGFWSLLLAKLFRKRKVPKMDIHTVIEKFNNKNGVKVRQLKKFDQAIGENLVRVLPERYMQRSVSFLNRRFFNHPSREYASFIVTDKSGDFKGYIILSKVNVLDFGAVEQRFLPLLFEFAREYFLANRSAVGNVLVAGNADTVLRIKIAGFFRWNFKSRPFGLYRPHTLMIRYPVAAKQKAERNNRLFTMCDINCGF